MKSLKFCEWAIRRMLENKIWNFLKSCSNCVIKKTFASFGKSMRQASTWFLSYKWLKYPCRIACSLRLALSSLQHSSGGYSRNQPLKQDDGCPKTTPISNRQRLVFQTAYHLNSLFTRSKSAVALMDISIFMGILCYLDTRI